MGLLDGLEGGLWAVTKDFAVDQFTRTVTPPFQSSG